MPARRFCDKKLEEKNLSHVDRSGRARMVDVSQKPAQNRRARAYGRITLSTDTVKLVKNNEIKKGDVLTVAEIAGVQAAKRTSEWVPLCHNIPIANIQVKATLEKDGVSIESDVISCGPTGVEMEALVAVSAALLAVYDMCKSADKNMIMGEIRLIEKKKDNIVVPLCI